MHPLITLSLLTSLELILGIDNILMISLLVAPLKRSLRQSARRWGLFFALLARLYFVVGAFRITQSTTPLFFHYSLREIVLILGGLFLLGKGLKELYYFVEVPKKKIKASSSKSLFFIVLQIVLLDLTFSMDSVIAAVGLSNNLIVISLAVIISFVALLLYAAPVGEFILQHVAFKIIILLFLILLGVFLLAEGFGFLISKALLYAPLFFSLVIEWLRHRYQESRNDQKRRPSDRSHPTFLNKPSNNI